MIAPFRPGLHKDVSAIFDGVGTPGSKRHADEGLGPSHPQNPLIAPGPGVSAAVVRRRHRRGAVITIEQKRSLRDNGLVEGLKAACRLQRQRAKVLLVLILFVLYILLLMAIRLEWWPFIGSFFGMYAFGVLGGKLSRPRTSVEAQLRVLLELLIPAGLVILVLLLMVVQSPLWPLGGVFFGAYVVGLFGGRFLRARPGERTQNRGDAWTNTLRPTESPTTPQKATSRS